MDKIHIRDIEVACIIGINPDERERLQTVCVNVSMTCDLSPGFETDRMEDSLDYRAVTKSIVGLLKESRYGLIERMAEAVTQVCLEHERVREVTVCVDKPGALRDARSVAVEMTRFQR